MEYFDTWGTDFIKMRCISKKTKSAYMAQIGSQARIENYLETIEPEYLKKCKAEIEKFKEKLKNPEPDEEQTNVPSIFSKNGEALDVDTENRLVGIIKAPAEKVKQLKKEAGYHEGG